MRIPFGLISGRLRSDTFENVSEDSFGKLSQLKGLQTYSDRATTARQAASLIRNGDHVFIGSACATPRSLVSALESIEQKPKGIEFVHFVTNGAIQHDADGRALSSYRHRTFFVGQEIRAAVKQGLAEYVPLSIVRVPSLIAIGQIPVDVALIQVSLPDEFGYVSLGVSVDIIPAAIARARLVIAEVNAQMPRTLGDSTIHMRQIHRFVPVNAPLAEFSHQGMESEPMKQIARYISGIIEDGSTLHIGLGRVTNEALKYLADRKDIGIHSDVITDAIIPLLESGCLTGKRKSHQPNKIVTSFAVGTKRLYELIDCNPLFSFQPIDVVANPANIAAQYRMVSVTQAFSVDLTGQVCADQHAGESYSGLAAQLEFLRGAARSEGGKAIICLASLEDDGETSRIKLNIDNVTIARSDVHYVITEYGIAYLFGKSLRERAVAMIEIAHPDIRASLFRQAQAAGLLPAEQALRNLHAYPVHEEVTVTLKDKRTVLVRPATSSDANAVRQLFHKLPQQDVFTRFFRNMEELSSREIQRLCNLNFDTEVAFVAVNGPRENQEVVAQSCYFVDPSTNVAETAFIVHPDWQGVGLGTELQRHMTKHARARGVQGFLAEVLPGNTKMISLARSGSENVSVKRTEESMQITFTFDEPHCPFLCQKRVHSHTKSGF